MADKYPVIVVVGSGSGIGRAIYDTLVDKRIPVRGLDLKYADIDPMIDMDEGCMAVGRRWYMDVTKPETMEEIHRRFNADNLSVAGLVYCIGNNTLRWIHDGIADVAQRLFETNVVGIFRCLDIFMPFMVDTTRIVLYSSIAGEVPMRTTSVYCSTKAAVDMLVKCLARELAPRAVFCIKPGPTEGKNSWFDCKRQIHEMRGWSYDKIDDMTIADIPMKTLATHRQCVDATMHCLLEAPDHASGTVYRLTGGR